MANIEVSDQSKGSTKVDNIIYLDEQIMVSTKVGIIYATIHEIANIS